MTSIDKIKKLREITGVSIIECKKALSKADGNIEKAQEILRTWGKNFAAKKIEEETRTGIIASYVHPNSKIGVLADIRCESDFVARGEDFKKLSHEICLQIAAMKPLYVKEEDIPEEFLASERKIYQEQFKDSGKPQKIMDEIIKGKLKKRQEEISLLSQPWVKEETKNISDLIDEYIAKIGEKIEIKKFVRYEI
ncbi:MAG: elongation factor Ts [Candidatus Staskawiczbacteria bacterium CG10_big_fil_rev_8_21_14_0_10_38_10]|uniref:Elongation factor Ts n=1 Tax=Candidatus Staskawiczbacteria bacterium CG10_big_fil_rev_8_21_14_0_10_38_10 TaxID=1974891 RepID=A0A2H9T1Q0_9BACT|nr:MAG: elongation factor Ts [Candidatus Staskawiczbacteria bacterium CG10_big_fil_rev_8_21_14_0_10_38_10]